MGGYQVTELNLDCFTSYVLNHAPIATALGGALYDADLISDYDSYSGNLLIDENVYFDIHNPFYKFSVADSDGDSITVTPISSPAPYFNLTSTGNVYTVTLSEALSLNNLPIEDFAPGSKSHVYTMRLNDNQNPAATATLPLYFTIKDNNRPLFSQASYAFSIPENSTTTVGSAVATKQNSSDTLSYSIASNPSNAFSISSNGLITVNDPSVLNYEATTSLIFKVVAVATLSGPRSASSTLTAQSKTSTTTVTVNLTDVAEIPILSLPTTSAITQTTVTLNAGITSNGSAPSTIRGFEYGLTTSYGSTASSAGTYNTGSYSQAVTGLTQSTLYHYRAYATNTAGTGVSTDGTFTTAALPVTPPTVTVQSATSLTTSTVTLNGTITNNNNASSTIRGFEYGLTTSYGSTASSAGTYNTGSYSQAVTGLTQSTLYHYRAYATNTAGTGVSTDGTFTTATSPDTTAPVISALTVSPTDTTTLITWSTNESASTTLKYGTSLSYGSVQNSAVLTTTHSYTLASLTPSTTYHYKISVQDALGNLISSTDSTFMTTATVVIPVYSGGGSSGGGASYSAPVVTTPPPQTATSTATTTEIITTSLVNSLCPVGLTCTLLRPTTVSSISPAFSSYIFTRDLSLTITHLEVQLLQKYLNSQGYTVSPTGAGSVGNESTYFGPATRNALTKFQRDHNITPASGYFGSITREYIQNNGQVPKMVPFSPIATQLPTAPTFQTVAKTLTLKLGDNNISVKNMRTALRSLGYLSSYGSVNAPTSTSTETSYFGKETEDIIKKYQCDQQIACSGTVLTTGWGMLGPKTIKALGIASTVSVDTKSTSSYVCNEVTKTCAVALIQVSQQGATSTVVSTQPNTPDIPVLKLGSVGLLVKNARIKLRTLGYLDPYGAAGTPKSKIEETDYFGYETETVVKKFQCDQQIVCSGTAVTTGWGVIGAMTTKALEK